MRSAACARIARYPKPGPTRRPDAPPLDPALADLAKQEQGGQPAADAAPQIQLLSATANGAPNIVSLDVAGVDTQSVKELDDNYVAMPLALAQQLVYGRGEHKVTGIVLQLHQSEDVPAARARLLSLIAERHLPLEVRDYRELNPFFVQVVGLFSLIFLFLTVIMIVIVLFAVVNTMTMNVLERTAEIGTVRAMGVRRASMRWQFLAEGAVLGALGATLGVALAFIAIVADRSCADSPGRRRAIPIRCRSSWHGPHGRCCCSAPGLVWSWWRPWRPCRPPTEPRGAGSWMRCAMYKNSHAPPSADRRCHCSPGRTGCGAARNPRTTSSPARTRYEIPGSRFVPTTVLTEYVQGKPKDQTVLTVYSKEDKATGQFRNLVRYVEPPRDAGKMALLDGQNLWFYDPGGEIQRADFHAAAAGRPGVDRRRADDQLRDRLHRHLAR